MRWRTRGADGSHSPKIARSSAGDAQALRAARGARDDLDHRRRRARGRGSSPGRAGPARMREDGSHSLNMLTPPPACSHVAPLLAARAALRHLSQPHLRLADVPVLLRRRHAERMAFRAPGQPRRRRRGAGVRRGERRHARGPHHAVGRGHLVGSARARMGAGRRIHPRAGRGAGDPDRARGPQGLVQQAVAGRQAAGQGRGRVEDARAERGRVRPLSRRRAR